jgi:hypothetical protein
VVIAHNAGHHWPAHALKKIAGTIEVRISEPIQPNGRDSKTLSDAARLTLSTLMKDLPGNN